MRPVNYAVNPVNNPYFGARSSYQRPSEITQAPGYATLIHLQQYGARMAYDLLKLADAYGYIQPDKIHNICEFGAGIGGPTYALKQFFNPRRGELVALELMPEAGRFIAESKIIPATDLHVDDGIQYLRNGRHKYDLITAFMLGPDGKGDFARQFIQAGRSSLKPGGKLMVCSDPLTMLVIEKICKQENIRFTWLKEVPPENIHLPYTAFLSFDKPASTS